MKRTKAQRKLRKKLQQITTRLRRYARRNHEPRRSFRVDYQTVKEAYLARLNTPPPSLQLLQVIEKAAIDDIVAAEDQRFLDYVNEAVASAAAR